MSWGLAFHSAKLLLSYLFPYKMKTFREAIFDADVDRIRELAAGRPRLLQQSIDADGNTALGLAILLGEVEIVKTLLELGSDPNLANAFDGNHPIVFLAKFRSEENAKTPLLAELLLDAGSDPLHEIRYQADTTSRLDATQTPSYHETPLFCCVRFQHEELLKKIIEHNIDIDSLNPETGTSALMLAAGLGYINMCNMLIDAGADVNSNDHAGNTPLHLAAQGYGEQLPIIQTLLQRGADANAVNEDGITPAALAKNTEKDACFKLLNSQTSENAQLPPYQQSDDIEQEPTEQSIFSFT